MADITQDVVRTVGRHYVSLSCVQRSTGSDSPKLLVFSGFIIDVLGEWLYVTAGHVLRDIRTAISSCSTFDIWRLGDQTAGGKFRETAVPYAFDESVWLVVEDESLGLDYAAVHLPWIYRRQLEAGGVVAIAKNAWSDQHTEFDHWALMGIPSESVDYDGENEIKARAVFIPVLPTVKPEGVGEKSNNQFYAKLSPGSEKVVSDLDGLSGSPVVSLKKVDGLWYYNLIGVQSGWYLPSRTLAICPFATFAFELERLAAESQCQEGNG